MNVRTLETDDAEELRALWSSAAHFDPLSPELLQEKVWDDPDFDPELTLVGVIDGRIAAAGMAVGRARDEATCCLKMFGVADGFRRRGYGTALLRHLESRLAERGFDAVRVGESSPNYLTPGVDVRYTHAISFFEARGFARIGQTYNMSVDLTRAAYDTQQGVDDLAARGVDIRRAEKSDHPALDRFLKKHWPAWRKEVGMAFRNDPVSLHLARMDGKIVAFSAYDCNNVGTSWFGPMGTAEASRGKGLGTVLLWACLDDLRDQGHERAIIPWVGPVDFYVHAASARISRVFFRYEKSLVA